MGAETKQPDTSLEDLKPVLIAFMHRLKNLNPTHKKNILRKLEKVFIPNTEQSKSDIEEYLETLFKAHPKLFNHSPNVKLALSLLETLEQEPASTLKPSHK